MARSESSVRSSSYDEILRTAKSDEGRGYPVDLANTLQLHPLSFSDETILSQFGRMHVESANQTSRQTYKELLGTAPVRLSYYIPLQLIQVAKKMPGSLGENTEQLLRENTLFPLFELFAQARFVCSDKESFLEEQIRQMPKRIVGQVGRTGLCLACLREDRTRFGSPFIHRSHLIPGVRVCWKHGQPIVYCCQSCGCPYESKHDLVLAPWLPCSMCGHHALQSPLPSKLPAADGNAQAYALFAKELLEATPIGFDARTLTQLYTERLRDLGFARGQGINRMTAVKAIEEFFGPALLGEIDTAYRGGRDIHWLRLCTETESPEVPLPRHLLFACFLFRDAGKFLSAAKELQLASMTLGISTGSCVRIGRLDKSSNTEMDDAKAESRSTEDVAQEFQENLASIIREKPELTVEDLWRNYRGIMKQFIRVAPSAFKTFISQLDRVALEKRTASPQEDQPREKDLQLAARVAVEAKSLYESADYPTKVTQSLLLRKSGCRWGYLADSESFPLSRQELEKWNESKWHFHARRIVWALQKFGSNKSAPTTLSKLVRIECERGKLLVELFKHMAPGQRLDKGSVMKVLKEHGISLNWAGPKPDNELIQPGRKYWE